MRVCSLGLLLLALLRTRGLAADACSTCSLDARGPLADAPSLTLNCSHEEFSVTLANWDNQLLVSLYIQCAHGGNTTCIDVSEATPYSRMRKQEYQYAEENNLLGTRDYNCTVIGCYEVRNTEYNLRNSSCFLSDVSTETTTMDDEIVDEESTSSFTAATTVNASSGINVTEMDTTDSTGAASHTSPSPTNKGHGSGGLYMKILFPVGAVVLISTSAVTCCIMILAHYSSSKKNARNQYNFGVVEYLKSNSGTMRAQCFDAVAYKLPTKAEPSSAESVLTLYQNLTKTEHPETPSTTLGGSYGNLFTNGIVLSSVKRKAKECEDAITHHLADQVAVHLDNCMTLSRAESAVSPPYCEYSNSKHNSTTSVNTELDLDSCSREYSEMDPSAFPSYELGIESKGGHLSLNEVTVVDSPRSSTELSTLDSPRSSCLERSSWCLAEDLTPSTVTESDYETAVDSIEEELRQHSQQEDNLPAEYIQYEEPCDEFTKVDEGCRKFNLDAELEDFLSGNRATGLDTETTIYDSYICT